MDDCKQKIIELINGAQDVRRLELVLRFVRRLLG